MKLAQFDINEINNKVWSGGDHSVYSCIQKINPQTGALQEQCRGSVTPFFVNIVNFLLWGIGIAVVIVLIYGGFTYVTAGADPNRADLAKKIIIGAVIGAVIVAAALIIYNTTIGVIESGATTL